ncbi:unnamed protein product [Ilex paraguariensis]|uniref:USP domain-containing protein n=1 Tax=Ilex paraguariensis TaxID=185542 RepID=A0ABC8TKT3_9AQUA
MNCINYKVVGGKLHGRECQIFSTKIPKAVCSRLLQNRRTKKHEPHMKSSVERDLRLINNVLLSHLSDNIEKIGGSSMFFGIGMRNCIGENNCFINATIQSLWHLRRFRDELLSPSEHVHVGDPCVVCAVHQLFKALSMANTDGQREPVSPTSLRIALSILYPANVSFCQGREGEAYEVLENILFCLHDSFIHRPGVSDVKLLEKKGIGSLHFTSKTCVAHTFFGLDDSCGLQSARQNKNSYFRFIAANELGKAKIMHARCSLDEPLKLLKVDENIQLVCIDDVGGGRKLIRINGVQSTPHVFALGESHIVRKSVILVLASLVVSVLAFAVIGWETADDMLATWTALSTEVEIGFLDKRNRYRLVSVGVGITLRKDLERGSLSKFILLTISLCFMAPTIQTSTIPLPPIVANEAMGGSSGHHDLTPAKLFAIVSITFTALLTTMSMKDGSCLRTRMCRILGVGMIFFPHVKTSYYYLRSFSLKL